MLGVFPIVSNLRKLFNVGIDEANLKNAHISERAFATITIICAILWIICGLFTPQWKFVVALLVINNLTSYIVNAAIQNKTLLLVYEKLTALFTISMITWIILIRLGVSDVIINYFKTF